MITSLFDCSIASQMNRPMRQVCRGPKLGIEVECEGDRLPVEVEDWNVHEDHSLRQHPGNPREYVFSRPMPIDAAEAAVTRLIKAFGDNDTILYLASPRTSIHVHVNMQDTSVIELYNMVLLYSIFETPLVHWCGEQRESNLFCLRYKDTSQAVENLCQYIGGGRPLWSCFSDDQRYLACNLASLAKFGTIEFRSLGGVYDKDKIMMWCRTLLYLRELALTFDNPAAIVKEIDAEGIDKFYETRYTTKVFEKGLVPLPVDPPTLEDLYEGLLRLQPVVYQTAWPVKKNVEIRDGNTARPEPQFRAEAVLDLQPELDRGVELNWQPQQQQRVRVFRRAN